MTTTDDTQGHVRAFTRDGLPIYCQHPDTEPCVPGRRLERTPDTMLLDIVAHADEARSNFQGLREGPIARRVRVERLRSWGVQA